MQTPYIILLVSVILIIVLIASGVGVYFITRDEPVAVIDLSESQRVISAARSASDKNKALVNVTKEIDNLSILRISAAPSNVRLIDIQLAALRKVQADLESQIAEAEKLTKAKADAQQFADDATTRANAAKSSAEAAADSLSRAQVLATGITDSTLTTIVSEIRTASNRAGKAATDASAEVTKARTAAATGNVSTAQRAAAAALTFATAAATAADLTARKLSEARDRVTSITTSAASLTALLNDSTSAAQTLESRLATLRSQNSTTVSLLTTHSSNTEEIIRKLTTEALSATQSATSMMTSATQQIESARADIAIRNAQFANQKITAATSLFNQATSSHEQAKTLLATIVSRITTLADQAATTASTKAKIANAQQFANDALTRSAAAKASADAAKDSQDRANVLARGQTDNQLLIIVNEIRDLSTAATKAYNDSLLAVSNASIAVSNIDVTAAQTAANSTLAHASTAATAADNAVRKLSDAQQRLQEVTTAAAAAAAMLAESTVAANNIEKANVALGPLLNQSFDLSRLQVSNPDTIAAGFATLARDNVSSAISLRDKSIKAIAEARAAITVSSASIASQKVSEAQTAYNDSVSKHEQAKKLLLDLTARVNLLQSQSFQAAERQKVVDQVKQIETELIARSNEIKSVVDATNLLPARVDSLVGTRTDSLLLTAASQTKAAVSAASTAYNGIITEIAKLEPFIENANIQSALVSVTTVQTLSTTANIQSALANTRMEELRSRLSTIDTTSTNQVITDASSSLSSLESQINSLSPKIANSLAVVNEMIASSDSTLPSGINISNAATIIRSAENLKNTSLSKIAEAKLAVTNRNLSLLNTRIQEARSLFNESTLKHNEGLSNLKIIIASENFRTTFLTMKTSADIETELNLMLVLLNENKTSIDSLLTEGNTYLLNSNNDIKIAAQLFIDDSYGSVSFFDAMARQMIDEGRAALVGKDTAVAIARLNKSKEFFLLREEYYNIALEKLLKIKTAVFNNASTPITPPVSIPPVSIPPSTNLDPLITSQDMDIDRLKVDLSAVITEATPFLSNANTSIKDLATSVINFAREGEKKQVTAAAAIDAAMFSWVAGNIPLATTKLELAKADYNEGRIGLGAALVQMRNLKISNFTLQLDNLTNKAEDLRDGITLENRNNSDLAIANFATNAHSQVSEALRILRTISTQLNDAKKALQSANVTLADAKLAEVKTNLTNAENIYTAASTNFRNMDIPNTRNQIMDLLSKNGKIISAVAGYLDSANPTVKSGATAARNFAFAVENEARRIGFAAINAADTANKSGNVTGANTSLLAAKASLEKGLAIYLDAQRELRNMDMAVVQMRVAELYGLNSAVINNTIPFINSTNVTSKTLATEARALINSSEIERLKAPGLVQSAKASIAGGRLSEADATIASAKGAIAVAAELQQRATAIVARI